MTRVLGLALVGACILWLPPWHPILEIWTNTSLYLGVFGCSCVFLITLIRRYRTRRNLILVMLLLLIAGLRLFPDEAPPSSADRSTGRTLKLFWANVERENQNFEAFRDMVRTISPDMFVVAELTQTWESEISQLEDYRFKVALPDLGYFGIGLWSKVPLGVANRIVTDLGSDVPPIIVLTLNGLNGNQDLTVAALHASPPVSAQNLRGNKLLLRRLGTELRLRPGSLVVLGDFNATPSSTYYRNFVNWLELRNIFPASVLQKTWNANLPWAYFAIDHILVSKEVAVHAPTVLAAWGSDHLPIVVEISY